MSFARSERTALCETLRSAGADAPTLCEGWDAYTLAAHLYLRENGLAMMGNVIASRNDAVEAQLRDTKAAHSFADLVALIESGPTGFSPFRIPGVDAGVNLVEFFIHNEDVRRAGEHPLPPRVLSDEMEGALWSALGRSKKLFFRKAPFGVIVATPHGKSFAVGRDFEATLVGRPGELVLYSAGRTAAAEIEVKAEPLAAQRLAASLGL